MVKTYCKIFPSAMQCWYIEGTEIKHREEGPAVIYSNGDKAWYQHGKFHRENGPAIEFGNFHFEWWYQGKRILVDTQEDFERYINLMAFE